MPSLKEDTKKQIGGILKDHKQHALELADAYRLGRGSEEATGIAGMMSQAKLKIESKVRDEKSILRKLYDGEDQGIAAVENIIRGDLDSPAVRWWIKSFVQIMTTLEAAANDPLKQRK